MKSLMIIMLSIIALISCSSEDDPGKSGKDMESPTIDISHDALLSMPCPTAVIGETIVLTPIFRDNAELGNFTVDIHHNFDHHSHSTETGEKEEETCELEPVKSKDEIAELQREEKLLTYIQSTPIPGGLTYYEAKHEIMIKPDIEPGDYHCTIRVTDKAGWQSFRTFSLKLVK